MRLLVRLRHAVSARWTAFVMDPWLVKSAANPFDYDWLAD
jgi:hypothetical protein